LDADNPFATFLGLYSDVPEHAQLDDRQRAWFRAEMEAADAKKALNVAVHHPVYSFDDHHSGSPTMGKELEDAINTSRRGAREKGAFLAGDCRVAALLAMTV
jgi:hypothetical protein